MVFVMNKQPTLKPQDLLVALKIAVRPQQQLTYAALAKELSMSASEVHASTKRAEQSRLLVRSDAGLVPVRHSLQEFLIHGVKYAFPALTGPLTRGIPTGLAGPVLRQHFDHHDDLVPVWPDPEGDVRGISIYPIYPSVPVASRIDHQLYEVLTLIDALRGGAARERELAEQSLMERFC